MDDSSNTTENLLTAQTYSSTNWFISDGGVQSHPQTSGFIAAADSNYSLIMNGYVNSYGDSGNYNSPYYGQYLTQFRENFMPIHGWISVTVCLFGIIANILNIIVLTRKEMLSPTNAILTGLAVADMLVMTSYFPYSIHNFIRYGLREEEKYSYGWAVFTLIHAHSSIVCHTISIWLTVILAIWRYIAVSFPTDSKTWCNMAKAKYAIVFTYIACPVFCIPAYLTFSIKQNNITESSDNNAAAIYGTSNVAYTYNVNFSELAKRHNELLTKSNFWIFSVLGKLIPCIALTYLSLALIRVLYQANQRKQRLKQHGIDYNNIPLNKNLVVNSSQSCDRTTRMLLAILLLFLVTEFPSGIIALLSGILGVAFHRNVYNNLGEVMDLLALTNSAINFILYCTMSRQFRKTFTKLFCTTYTVVEDDNCVQRRRRQSGSALEPNTCHTTCV